MAPFSFVAVLSGGQSEACPRFAEVELTSITRVFDIV
jgi:hypothetical protein